MFCFRGCRIFLTIVTTVTVVTTVFSSFFLLQKNIYFLSTFVKSNLTHLTPNVMFSGLCFVILAMFLIDRLRDFVVVERLHDFVCGEVA